MKNKKDLFLVLFIFTIFFSISQSSIYATSAKKCTHTVYSTGDTGTYHYYYCSICGKCNGRSAHSTSSTSNYRKRFIS